MRLLVAIFAAALLLGAADRCFAQKGYGGYGRHAGFGHHGHGMHFGHGMHHGGFGGHGYGFGGHPHWHHGGLHHHRHYDFRNVPALPPPAFQAGPPAPTVTYPYYTTRGPRDFLLANPPSIGP